MKSILALSYILLIAYESFIYADPISSQNPAEPVHISIIDLIANKDQYHGKMIRLQGYACFEFERQALYLSILDAKHHISKNAIWIEIDPTYAKQKKYPKINKQWIMATGIYDKNDNGHLGVYSGTINSVSWINER